MFGSYTGVNPDHGPEMIRGPLFFVNGMSVASMKESPEFWVLSAEFDEIKERTNRDIYAT
jgi:hypothetical protein